MKKDSTFWVGYADMLTSLFFVMLVLFAIAFMIVKKQNEELEATVEQIKQIRQVEQALGSLDQDFYSFDEKNNRYKLNIDVLFKPGSDNINDISTDNQALIRSAGFELYNKVKGLVQQNPEIEYLLIIEGNAARYNKNWINIPDEGYKIKL